MEFFKVFNFVDSLGHLPFKLECPLHDVVVLFYLFLKLLDTPIGKFTCGKETAKCTYKRTQEAEDGNEYCLCHFYLKPSQGSPRLPKRQSP